MRVQVARKRETCDQLSAGMRMLAQTIRQRAIIRGAGGGTPGLPAGAGGGVRTAYNYYTHALIYGVGHACATQSATYPCCACAPRVNE